MSTEMVNYLFYNYAYYLLYVKVLWQDTPNNLNTSHALSGIIYM